jgi:hypothetical protein
MGGNENDIKNLSRFGSFREGYVLCDVREISINEGEVELNGHNTTISGTGYYTNTSLSIPCEEIERTGQTELTLNFCNDQNEEICVTLLFNIECDDCPPMRKGITSNTTSIDSYKVYPNPAMDIINIDSKSKATNQLLNLYDIYGKLIYSKEIFYGNNSILLNHFHSGIYTIELKDALQSYFTKVIIIE